MPAGGEDRQRTLAAAFERRGRGLHSGREATLRALPAAEGSGYVFRRVDLPGSPEVRAGLDCVSATERGTVISRGQASAATVEHLLGTLYGLGVDNAILELDGPEVPILDGSGQLWAEAVAEAGLQVQDQPRKVLELLKPFAFERGGKSFQARPGAGFQVRYRIDYGQAALGEQVLELELGPDSFRQAICRARTFCFEHEVEALRQAGLIKGGDLDCALVVGPAGVLNPPLRYPDEFVRHKILDFLGDLALGGLRLRGSFSLERAGHSFHVEAVKALLASPAGEFHARTPMSEAPTLLDTNAIQALLPHRYPLLLLDRVSALELGSRVTGWKNVSMNEWFFQGHFPGHPIYPGVLIVEGLAQCGGVLIMKSYPQSQGKLTYFMAIDGVRFRRPVVPGDRLRYEVEIVKVKGPVSRLKGRAFVGEELATEAEFMCMSVDPAKAEAGGAGA